MAATLASTTIIRAGPALRGCPASSRETPRTWRGALPGSAAPSPPARGADGTPPPSALPAVPPPGCGHAALPGP
ncbi:MAG: hypothetical protein F9K13_13710 [Candidatus Methylomirabilis oxygeniifera]|nr:MAG: hypothetical protein F9K13_13710 [Candidatus Methylomirabilis oxyfera]